MCVTQNFSIAMVKIPLFNYYGMRKHSNKTTPYILTHIIRLVKCDLYRTFCTAASGCIFTVAAVVIIVAVIIAIVAIFCLAFYQKNFKCN